MASCLPHGEANIAVLALELGPLHPARKIRAAAEPPSDISSSLDQGSCSVTAVVTAGRGTKVLMENTGSCRHRGSRSTGKAAQVGLHHTDRRATLCAWCTGQPGEDRRTRLPAAEYWSSRTRGLKQGQRLRLSRVHQPQGCIATRFRSARPTALRRQGFGAISAPGRRLP